MMEPVISNLNNKAGLRIFTRTWLPQQNVKGIAHERLKKEIPQITLPVLILHGTSDKAAGISEASSFMTMQHPQTRH